MSSLGKILIFVGLALVAAGIVISLGGRLSWFGRLPGDILVHKKNLNFYFPITTSILLSVLITAIMMLVRRR